MRFRGPFERFRGPFERLRDPCKPGISFARVNNVQSCKNNLSAAPYLTTCYDLATRASHQDLTYVCPLPFSVFSFPVLCHNHYYIGLSFLELEFYFTLASAASLGKKGRTQVILYVTFKQKLLEDPLLINMMLVAGRCRCHTKNEKNVTKEKRMRIRTCYEVQHLLSCYKSAEDLFRKKELNQRFSFGTEARFDRCMNSP